MRLKDEDRRIKIKSQIEKVQMHMDKLHLMLKKDREKLSKLELELVNRTATIRAMPAVKLPIQAYRPESLEEAVEVDLAWEELEEIEDGEI